MSTDTTPDSSSHDVSKLAAEPDKKVQEEVKKQAEPVRKMGLDEYKKQKKMVEEKERMARIPDAYREEVTVSSDDEEPESDVKPQVTKSDDDKEEGEVSSSSDSDEDVVIISSPTPNLSDRRVLPSPHPPSGSRPGRK